MSQRTFLGRSTAGCTILYLMREMNAKIPHALMHNILLSSLYMYMADARQLFCLPMFKSFHLLINLKMLQMFDVIGSIKLFVVRMNGLML